jgi:large subunit ribosomal protein L4
MPKKMRRQALRCALSALVRDEQLVVVESLDVSDGRTKTLANVLENLIGDESAVILLAEKNINVERGVRNLSNAMYLRANYLNIRDLLKYDKVIMPLDALELITNWLGTDKN